MLHNMLRKIFNSCFLNFLYLNSNKCNIIKLHLFFNIHSNKFRKHREKYKNTRLVSHVWQKAKQEGLKSDCKYSGLLQVQPTFLYFRNYRNHIFKAINTKLFLIYFRNLLQLHPLKHQSASHLIQIKTLRVSDPDHLQLSRSMKGKIITCKLKTRSKVLFLPIEVQRALIRD